MKGTIGIRRAVAAAFLAASAMHGFAWAQTAVSSAQPLTFGGSGTAVSASVDATITGGTAAVYSFWANEGDIVTVDIDSNSAVDTMVSIHSPAPAYSVDAVMDDWQGTTLDSGSITPLDPYIQGWVAPATGIHYVAVTISPDRVVDGGSLLALGGSGSGAFSLIISCASPDADAACEQAATTPPPVVTDPPPPPPPVVTDPPPPPVVTDPTPPSTDIQVVRIDVRPGSRALVRLNPKWNNTIPVAILSSRSFDARTVDVNSLTFGRTGDEQSLRKCNKGFAHLNRDRRPDLVCHFDNQRSAFELGDEEGVLKGTTVDGKPIEGRAMLKVLPEKRHYGHNHGKGHKKDADNDHRKGNQRQTSWWSRW